MEYIDIAGLYYVDITSEEQHVHTALCYGDAGLICDYAWFDEGGEAGGA